MTFRLHKSAAAVLLAAVLEAVVFAMRIAGAAEPAHGAQGIAATGHPLATEAAIAAMKDGGNAIDAAVAAALTLGVVDGSNSGIGGGCFLLIRTASGEFFAIDGRETAPRAIKPESFLRDGKADTRLSQTGALASGTPGALAAYDLALSRFGRLPLKTPLLAAAEIAERGFTVDRIYAKRLKEEASDLKSFADARAIFLTPDETPFKEGDVVRQIDLARTYRNIAEFGASWFYEGPFADACEAWMRANGGMLASSDFKEYRALLRDPVRGTYRGCEIISFPPPSSGGVHLIEMLNLLESFDLRKLGPRSADEIHLVAEAMKLAFADRAHWLGDPDFVPVPRGLISKEYAADLAGKIQMEKAAAGVEHGRPKDAEADIFKKHTTHFSTADAEGNWVACTATINTAFGSKVVIPGTGVLMNNEMDDFALQPGVPNAFKLVGGSANAIAPGKRPLSSMTPTIVLKDGEPILAVGAAGGPTIITQTLLAIIDTIDFDMDIAAALAAPRFHHQWSPPELRIETAMSADVREALRQRGHVLSETDAFGATQAVARPKGAPFFSGAADPRGRGSALGW
jgi:gamma-glutamyltranspeptidase/glutathione hydrolase